MIRFFLVLFLISCFASSAWSDDNRVKKSPASAPIRTHWTTLGGMQYFQEDKALSGLELKSTIDSINDPQASGLLRKSESDETLGFWGLGGSVVLSVLSLFFPNTHIHLGRLDISTPYMPIAVPGAALGVAGELLELEANTAKYTAVQRYNQVTKQPDSVTWNLSPQKDGLNLDVGYAF